MQPMLEHLRSLAYNLWWSWDSEAAALWAEVDPYRWERCGHNPVALLADVEPERWEMLSLTPFAQRVEKVHQRFRQHLETPGWCEGASSAVHSAGVAYFSMEFGLHESVHLYSGGLGVLAGDHLRSASDLGVPLVGVSLLYRSGYFRQLIDDGRQIAAYPEAEWRRLPIRPCLGSQGQLRIDVPIGARLVKARLWQLDVGRCRLVLLDTDDPENTPEERQITGQLYGGDEWMRIRQEVVLGIGGVRALGALGVSVGVYHLNEGHCAFVPLALIADRVVNEGLTPEDAAVKVRRSCVFTTHTPVPAGHDRFHKEAVEAALGPWCAESGLTVDEVMDLGRVVPGAASETLCMTVLALKTSAASNGVSALHGRVSREMWAPLWPERTPSDVPIHHVTNGVHPTFWMAPEARTLFDRYLPDWRARPWDPEVWAGVDEIPDLEWMALRDALRRRLCQEIRSRSDRKFDPDALTIGFARRFAPYKRGNLLFRDPERLRTLLRRHPVQIVFAGKAHPRDGGGKDILAEVVRRSEAFDFRNRVVLVQDYDMALGRLITAGADVWLNNPRRPHEASGTSGQKVVLNGGLNLSVLDGWWPEGFDGTNGWAIGAGEEWTSEPEQDAFDAEALYAALEQSVLPDWENRVAGVPAQWIARIRRSLKTCAPLFNSHRMVRDYVLDFYSPQVS